jgi:sec-independent protein translocase protein TatB
MAAGEGAATAGLFVDGSGKPYHSDTMPGFQDSAFLILLALLLFGPKKLPVLARQLGKLMGDFRRASNEFRAQMEDELRIAEQADRQKEIAKLETAAPKQAVPSEAVLNETGSSEIEQPGNEGLPPLPLSGGATGLEAEVAPTPSPSMEIEPLPIATAGELSIMPPATGLPVANTSLAPFVESIPVAQGNGAAEAMHGGVAVAEMPVEAGTEHKASADNGASNGAAHENEARPWMI